VQWAYSSASGRRRQGEGRACGRRRRRATELCRVQLGMGRGGQIGATYVRRQFGIGQETVRRGESMWETEKTSDGTMSHSAGCSGPALLAGRLAGRRGSGCLNNVSNPSITIQWGTHKLSASSTSRPKPYPTPPTRHHPPQPQRQSQPHTPHSTTTMPTSSATVNAGPRP
jgi:hypothetical protein